MRRDNAGPSGHEGSSSFGVGTMLLIVLVMVLAYFPAIPGFPKGLIVGYEFGTSAMPMPLRLPLLRPVHLRRGEAIQFQYASKVRSGAITLGYRHSKSILSFGQWVDSYSVSAIRSTTRGMITFIPQHDGYYYFMAGGEQTSSNTQDCKAPLMDFVDAARGKMTRCPNFNVAFGMIIW